MIKNFARYFSVLFAFLLSFAAVASAQTEPKKDFPNIKIKNFGQMDDNYYRGAQPKKEDYKSLADLGVKTVIDLRDTPEDYAKSSAETAGLKYINLPMSDSIYPKAEDIETFLKLINDPTTGAFYVHCKGGRHRTGITAAVYRFTKYGWDYDKVYQEMKNYDFYTRWGHGAMKDFVVDYANKMKMAKAETVNSTTQAEIK